MSAYEWHITVLQYGFYGDRVVSKTPAVIIAATKAEVTEKMRAAFDADYDSFRKFWSHDWVLREMREVPTAALDAVGAALGRES